MIRLTEITTPSRISDHERDEFLMVASMNIVFNVEANFAGFNVSNVIVLFEYFTISLTFLESYVNPRLHLI
jgi:hypothetical protein